MQQPPALPMPSSATGASPGFAPTATGMDISDAGVKFSTALFQALGVAPTSNRMTDDLIQQLLARSGSPEVSMETMDTAGGGQASGLPPVGATSTSFDAWFAALVGELPSVPSPSTGESATRVSDALIGSLPSAGEFSVPFEALADLLANEAARLATEATDLAEPAVGRNLDGGNDSPLEIDRVPVDGAQTFDLANQLLADLADAGKFTQISIAATGFVDAPAVPGAVNPTTRAVAARGLGLFALNGTNSGPGALEGQGSPPGGGMLPLGLLPKEAKLEVPRAVLGRFQASSAAPAAIPNPSLLTDAELSAQGVSTEDRSATVLARIDRVEFVTRMSQALERAHVESPKVIELELNPPSLGKLRIQVVDVGGQLTARIEAETPQARSILLDHLPILDRNLSDHGIQMQKVQVNHPAAQVAQFAGGGFGQPQQQARQQPGSNGRAVDERDADEPRGSTLSIRDLLAWAPGMNRLI